MDSTKMMRDDIRKGAIFITKFMRIQQTSGKLRNDFERLELFCQQLQETLFSDYQNYWYADNPLKGSASRCLRINNQQIDPLILKAGRRTGFDETRLKQLFPNELTVWIDPGDVAYRIGESHGSICSVVYADDAKKEYSEIFSGTVGLGPSVNNGVFKQGSSQSSEQEDTMKNKSKSDNFIMDPYDKGLSQYAPARIIPGCCNSPPSEKATCPQNSENSVIEGAVAGVSKFPPQADATSTVGECKAVNPNKVVNQSDRRRYFLVFYCDNVLNRPPKCFLWSLRMPSA